MSSSGKDEHPPASTTSQNRGILSFRKSMSRARKELDFSLLIVASVVFAIVPLTSYSYLDYVLMTAMSFIIFAASWDLLYSYSGQLTFGHALQYGLGGFFFAILAFQSHVPLIPAIIIGGLGSCALGAIFGMTTLRLSPVYQGTALLLLSLVHHKDMIGHGHELFQVMLNDQE